MGGEWRGNDPDNPVAQAPREASPFARTPSVEPNGDRIASRVTAARGRRRQRMALMLLVAAIGLLVVVTGRDLRRYL
jgi:hypothetical protein